MSDILTVDELAAVARVMTEAGTEPAGPLTSTLIAGGRSNLTLRLCSIESGQQLGEIVVNNAGRVRSTYQSPC